MPAPSGRFCCARCGAGCSLDGTAVVRFGPSGSAYVACSAACAGELRSVQPEVVPLLAETEHGAHALRALGAALLALRRGQGAAIDAVARPLANAALLVLGVPLRTETLGGAADALVVDAALDAQAPLEQATLHLAALAQLGSDVRANVAEIAGCDVRPIDAADDSSAATLEAIARRVQRAGGRLRELGFALPSAHAPARPRAPRSALARSWELIAATAAIGTPLSLGLVVAGALALLASPPPEAPLSLGCGAALDGLAAGTWVRIEGCFTDLRHAVDEAGRPRRAHSTYVPFGPAPGALHAYAHFTDRNALIDAGIHRVIDGTIAATVLHGAPIVLVGRTPSDPRPRGPLQVAAGTIGGLLAIALAFLAARGRRERRLAEARDRELSRAGGPYR